MIAIILSNEVVTVSGSAADVVKGLRPFTKNHKDDVIVIPDSQSPSVTAVRCEDARMAIDYINGYRPWVAFCDGRFFFTPKELAEFAPETDKLIIIQGARKTYTIAWSLWLKEFIK